MPSTDDPKHREVRLKMVVLRLSTGGGRQTSQEPRGLHDRIGRGNNEASRPGVGAPQAALTTTTL
jgi:hypothetical protein